MTATQAGTVSSGTVSSGTVSSGTVRTTLRPVPGVGRAHGSAPLARPELGGPSGTRAARSSVVRPGSAAVAACRVVWPEVRRAGVVLRVKVATIALVALVGLGASAAEISSWANPDPAVEYVAGDPAWAHVTGN